MQPNRPAFSDGQFGYGYKLIFLNGLHLFFIILRYNYSREFMMRVLRADHLRQTWIERILLHEGKKHNAIEYFFTQDQSHKKKALTP